VSARSHFVLWPRRGESAFLADRAKLSARRAADSFRVAGVHRRRRHNAGLLRGDGAFSEGAPDLRRAGRQPDFGWRADAHARLVQRQPFFANFQPSTFNLQPTMKRIGFIAMSGVRAHNPELTQLGLTLPGFVDRNKIIASLPSLGLLTLAGLTPEKFDVEYHEIDDLKKLPELPTHFDLVAISTFTAQLNEAYAVADFYRARKIPVVMGGITVSSLPEEAKQHCTSVVIGEGEPRWPEVLADFDCGALKPIYKPSREFDLANAPMPRFDLLDPDKYNRLTVQTSRGCPHRCEFCASSILLTPRYKVKPVEKVIAEIREIKKIWPRPFIEFADDNSFVHREHYKKLLRELAKEKLRWFTEADVRVADDDELLGLMRDPGCQQVLIGLESPCRTSLYGVELKSNWKLRQQDF